MKNIRQLIQEELSLKDHEDLSTRRFIFLQARVEAGGLRRKLERFTHEGEAADPQLLAIALRKCR